MIKIIVAIAFTLLCVWLIPCAGRSDLNCDGKVDIQDVSIVASQVK